jgi:peptidoglycan-associated lipoprotein
LNISPEHDMNIRFSSLILTSSAVAVMALAGCASSVKLDDAKPAPITNVPVGNGSSANNGASSAVAPVVTNNSANVDPVAGLAKVIYFDYDSYVVKSDNLPTIEGYAKVLNATKTRRLTIEGHTDDRGGREYNLALGQKRADATVKALTLLGVSSEQLEAVSFGKERPADEGASEEAYAKNRRAEFKGR